MIVHLRAILDFVTHLIPTQVILFIVFTYQQIQYVFVSSYV
jgi:hypothetical protein